MRHFFFTIIAIACTVSSMAWDTSYKINTYDGRISEFNNISVTNTRKEQVKVVTAGKDFQDQTIMFPEATRIAGVSIHHKLDGLVKYNGIVVGTMKNGIDHYDYTATLSIKDNSNKKVYIKKVVLTYLNPENCDNQLYVDDNVAQYFYKDSIQRFTFGDGDLYLRHHKITIEPYEPVSSIELFSRNQNFIPVSGNIDGEQVNSEFLRWIYESLNIENYQNPTAALCCITGIQIDYVVEENGGDVISEAYSKLLTYQKQYTEFTLHKNEVLLNQSASDAADVNKDGTINAADVVEVYNTIINGSASGNYNGIEYIDLGLPSEKLWATCDLGAACPEDYGDVFAWGETANGASFLYGKTEFTESNYQPYKEVKEMTSGELPVDYSPLGGTNPYALSWHHGGEGFTMASKADYDELRSNCDYVQTTLNGVKGYLFTSKANQKSIFFAASPYFEYTWKNDGEVYRWTTTCTQDTNAIVMQNGRAMWQKPRHCGFPIRCVIDKSILNPLHK